MKSIFYFLYKIYYILIFIPIQVIHSLFSAILCVLFFPVFGPDWVSHNVGVLWGRVLMYASLSRVEVRGKEKLVNGKSYILIANHASSFDVYAIFGWIGRTIKWVMKKELSKIPIFGWATRVSGQIAVDRSNTESAIHSIKEAQKTIKPGVSIMFFPEGTRSRDGVLKAFKKGAYHFALDMRYDIVPITIKGAYEVKKPGRLFARPGKIEIIIHDPVSIENYSRKDMNELIAKTRESIAAPLNEA